MVCERAAKCGEFLARVDLGSYELPTHVRRLMMSLPKKALEIEVERTGIEPVTSGLQSLFLLNPVKVARRGKAPT